MNQRQCIRDLAANGEADSVFLLGSASLQQSRNGPYWRLELRDAGGTMEAKIWSPLSASFHELAAGQLVRVRGRVGLFRDQLQLTVDELRVLTEEEVTLLDLSEFMPASPRPVSDMQEELDAMIEREFTHAPWKAFIRSVLGDERVCRSLPFAPAAKSVHHAYVGGLLEHQLSVAGLCLRMADHYPELDRQLLCAAALLHDIGKLEEMSGGLVNDYTDAGRFLGHITQGLLMMEPHLVASGLEPELALHFRHLIASHHGELEYGSPRQPATAEAFALHYADNIDAKIAQWRGLFPPRNNASEARGGRQENGQERVGGLEWSPWQNLLGRALCRVPGTPPGKLADTSADTPASRADSLYTGNGASEPEIFGDSDAAFGQDEAGAVCGGSRDCGSEDVTESLAVSEETSSEESRRAAPVDASVNVSGATFADCMEEESAVEEAPSSLPPWIEVDMLAAEERARMAEREPEIREDAPKTVKDVPEKAESESGESNDKSALRKQRKRRKASEVHGERDVPEGSSGVPSVPPLAAEDTDGKAESRPDKAREKDLTQCSLL